MRLFLFLLAAPALWAAVDGTVINRTESQPQPGATVTLYKLGQAGMEHLESVTSDAQGKFRVDREVQGPHLIQTAFDGVTYNHILPPGRPATGLELEVYRSSKQPSGAKVVQHMVLLEPAEGEMTVNESIIYNNDGKLTFNNPDDGTLRFFLPAEANGKVRVMANAPQGMPIERAAEKTAQAGIFKVDFPVKPGETRFDLSYTVPFSSPASFTGKTLHGGGPVRIVAPKGVTLKGGGLELLGQEPRTQASVYGVKGQEFKVDVEGSGTLRAGAGAGEGQPAEGEDAEGGPGIQQIPARVYEEKFVILGLMLAILAVGFLLLYRGAASAGEKGKPRA